MCLSTPLACPPACRNWHNCQVSARERSRVSSWRARRGPVSLKGRVSGGAPGDAGRASMSGATARLIKWLPLISAMHMKGLCLLHDRFGASSPRDLPGYASGEAAREREKKTTMYRTHGLVLTQIQLMFLHPCVRACVRASARARVCGGSVGNERAKLLLFPADTSVSPPSFYWQSANLLASYNYLNNLWRALDMIMI